MAEVTHAPELQEQPTTLHMTYEEYLATRNPSVADALQRLWS